MSQFPDFQLRLESLHRLILSLAGLPDARTAAAACCALIAADFGDAGVALVRHDPGRAGDVVLADYPSGLGLDGGVRAETISAASITQAGVAIELLAWRSDGDRRFGAVERQLLTALVIDMVGFADRIERAAEPIASSPLDEETGLWRLSPFIDQIERRLDRLDVEDRAGSMLAFGWVRSDGLGKAEANAAVVRASVECLRDMLRPTDLLGRVAPTRIAAWCDGIDHLIGAERADRITAKLQLLLAETGRQVAVGIATRWPQSGDDPSNLLIRARAGLERARLAAATAGKPAIRVWQGDAREGV